MRRLGPLDRLIAALFVPVWLVSFGLSLIAAIQETGYPSVIVSASSEPDGYPTLVGFVPSFGGADSGLQIGDRLLAVGERDLRGSGHVALYGPFAQQEGREIDVRFERAGEIRGTSLAMGSYRMYWPRVVASAVFAFSALLLLLRAPVSPMVRVFVQTYMCVALLLACTFAGGTIVTYAAIVLHVGAVTLAAPLALRGAVLFPHGVAPSGWLPRLGPWVFALFGPLDASRFYEFPLSRAAGMVAMTVGAFVYIPLLISIVTRTYRRSDPLGRRQLKWFLYGLYIALTLPLIAVAMASLDVRFISVLVASMAALALIPIFLIISIARYNILDIDRLISSTASYSMIGFALTVALLTGVPSVSHAVSLRIGVEPVTVQLLVSAVLAAILVPLHVVLRPRIERIFFGEHYALDQAIERLLEGLTACQSPSELTRLTGERLDSLLRPESCVIYARGGQAFSPVFVRGRAVPPAFEAASPLIAALNTHKGPLAAARLYGGRRRVELSPFDRAALQTLGVPVVVPIQPGGSLVAFLVLGPKHSGDIYTSTDLGLLAAVADKISGELLRFGQREAIRESRAMQDRLKRYVPGAVVDQLVSGGEPSVGEREVSVLFVDIRGYATLVESLGAAEIFSTVNRYTTRVSEIIRKTGGNVVEFNGDGMMAVFGAPEELPGKERAATEAGREIVVAVRSLSDPGSAPIEVGVGIATGEAYVGNIQAADRLIWTAVGNTTNLAARLQELTREFGASMVIDAPTWRRAGTAAHGLETLEQVAIRGRAAPEELHVLPLDLSARSSSGRSRSPGQEARHPSPRAPRGTEQ